MINYQKSLFLLALLLATFQLLAQEREREAAIEANEEYAEAVAERDNIEQRMRDLERDHAPVYHSPMRQTYMELQNRLNVVGRQVEERKAAFDQAMQRFRASVRDVDELRAHALQAVLIVNASNGNEINKERIVGTLQEGLNLLDGETMRTPESILRKQVDIITTIERELRFFTPVREIKLQIAERYADGDPASELLILPYLDVLESIVTAAQNERWRAFNRRLGNVNAALKLSRVILGDPRVTLFQDETVGRVVNLVDLMISLLPRSQGHVLNYIRIMKFCLEQIQTDLRAIRIRAAHTNIEHLLGKMNEFNEIKSNDPDDWGIPFPREVFGTIAPCPRLWLEPGTELSRELHPNGGYAVNETVKLHFAGCDVLPEDAWVGIVPSETPHGDEQVNDEARSDNDLPYRRLGSDYEGVLEFQLPGKTGIYDFRLNDSDPTIGSGEELTSLTFRVLSANGVPNLSIYRPTARYDEPIYPNEQIHVYFSANENHDDSAWIGIFQHDVLHKDAAHNDAHDISYEYLRNANSSIFYDPDPPYRGAVIMTVPDTPGEYQLRLFDGLAGKETYFTNFTVEEPVVNEPMLRIESSSNNFEVSILAGSEFKVDFLASPEFDQKAWIGIVPSSVPHGSETVNDEHDEGRYQYIENQIRGRMSFTAPSEVGFYDVRMHDSDDNGREVFSQGFIVYKEVTRDYENTERGTFEGLWETTHGPLSGPLYFDIENNFVYGDYGQLPLGTLAYAHLTYYLIFGRINGQTLEGKFFGTFDRTGEFTIQLNSAADEFAGTWSYDGENNTTEWSGRRQEE